MHLSVQETWVRSLVWEDPACHGAAKPMCCGYCSPHTPEPVFHKRRPCTAARVAPALHLDIRRLTVQSSWPFKSSDAIVKQSRVSAGYFSGLRAWGRIGKDSTQPVFIDPLQIKASCVHCTNSIGSQHSRRHVRTNDKT